MAPSTQLIPPPTPDEQWAAAVIAASRAQRDYDDLMRDPTADDQSCDRAWLRLWKAQKLQTELLRAEESG